jgi:8-oxo-dGTP pyrophosphatase MutT (NUDIX family)
MPADPPAPGALAVTSTRVIYENRWMRLREDLTVDGDGRAGVYAVVEKSPGAVIVPLDDDGVWLIEQWRHPVGRRFWEFPQGAWEGAPDADPEELARGELAEETGLRAGQVQWLGRLYYAYGIADQPFDAWLATDLRPGDPRPEPEEAGMRVARVTVDELEAKIANGEIADAASVAAWHLAFRHRARQ